MVGVAVTNNRTGEVVSQRKGGTHGFISGQDSTTLIAYGAGIMPARKDSIRQTDIAPWIMEILTNPNTSLSPSKGGEVAH
jgi:hypothetical protein